MMTIMKDIKKMKNRETHEKTQKKTMTIMKNTAKILKQTGKPIERHGQNNEQP